MNPTRHSIPVSLRSRTRTIRWLITGGCGFIGTALIRRLVREGGSRIRVLDNLSVGTRKDLARVCDFMEISAESIGRCAAWRKNESERNEQAVSSIPASQPPSLPAVESTTHRVQLLAGDIRDAQTCLVAARDIDIIVHLAANTGVPQSLDAPRRDMEANVVGTFNMLESARENRSKRFVFASSGAPVGECSPPIHEEMPCHPVSPYGASKLAGEAYCSAFFRSYGVETVALRFGNVYGPGSSHKSSVVAKFVKNAMAGEALEVFGDGTQTRDFIFIEDLVDAILQASAANGAGGEVFQIATSRERTVNELAALLLSVLKEAGFPGAEIVHGTLRKGDVKRNFSDTAKAEKVLGWKARVDIEEGIVRTVQWFTKESTDQFS